MTRSLRLYALAAAALAFGCAAPETTAGPEATAAGAVALASAGNAGATGGGHYALPAMDVQFAFSAIQHQDGTASGRFHHAAVESDGLTVDVDGEVICVSFDAVNHRAWIGGIVTRNGSTDLTLQTPIHQPGQHVWFRVLDGGEGKDANDRTTFIGFKGAAGFNTSPEYCAGQPWPAADARTWPVTGQVQVRP